MLHAKVQDQRTSGSGEEDFFFFYHIWAWWTSWSCDLDHLYKINICSPFPRRLHMKLGIDWPRVLEKNIFEDDGYIHVHCRQLLIGHLTFFTLVQKVKIGYKKFMLL